MVISKKILKNGEFGLFLPPKILCTIHGPFFSSLDGKILPQKIHQV